MRLGPVPPGVRPVSDRAREGLFSSLALEVPEARVLDLFSGTGAMGIEALSRGAAHAVFVDSRVRGLGGGPRQPGPDPAGRPGHGRDAGRGRVPGGPPRAARSIWSCSIPPTTSTPRSWSAVLAGIGPGWLLTGVDSRADEGNQGSHACHSSTLGRREAAPLRRQLSFTLVPGGFDGPDRPMSGDVRPGDERPSRHHPVGPVRCFDTVVVGVLDNPSRSRVFAVEERVAMLKEASPGIANVTVRPFSGLLVEFAGAGCAVHGQGSARGVGLRIRDADGPDEPTGCGDVETLFVATSPSGRSCRRR